MTDNILYTVFTKCYIKVGKGRCLLSVTQHLCKLMRGTVKGEKKRGEKEIKQKLNKYECSHYDNLINGKNVYIQNVANIQSIDAFIGEFDIQKRAVPCFCRFTDPVSFEKPV